MEEFQFISPTKFILQRNAEQMCGEEIKRYSDSVLFVHYGNDYMYDSGLYTKIINSLTRAGVKWFELPGVQPNPLIGLVRKGIEICKKENIKCVLAVGGGSVIDTAKAVALGAEYEGDVWDFFSGEADAKNALPIGVVMTLPATGSEGSKGSVIRNEESGESADVLADCIRPKFALMNPELTKTITKRQTVFGIVDMFSHVLERYFSNSKNVNLSDYMCEGVMKAIITNSKLLLENMEDYDLRAEFMWTSIIAHNGVLAAGRQEDWATHAMGAQLSAQYNVTHGATLSVLFPVWAEYVYQENISRFVQFANRVFNVEVDFYNQENTAKEGIRKIREFFDFLGAPATLGELGIDNDENFERMANSVCKSGEIGGIKKLSQVDVEEIYRRAL